MATSGPETYWSNRISILTVWALAPWNSGLPVCLPPFIWGRVQVELLSTEYSPGLKSKYSSVSPDTVPSTTRSAAKTY